MKRPGSRGLAMLASAAALMAGMTISPVATPQAIAQEGGFHSGWQQPPQEYSDVQRQGFRAGLEAARHDLDRRLSPDPQRHAEFRRPQTEPRLRDDFRRGFSHGYEVAYQHRGDYDTNRHDWGR